MSDRFCLRVFAPGYAGLMALLVMTALGLSACLQTAPSGTAPGQGEPPRSAAPAPPPSPPTAATPRSEPPSAGAIFKSESGVAAGIAKKAKRDSKRIAIPEFDWPPPKASAENTIPDKWIRTGPATTLADVADKFEKALKLADYAQWSYYAVPHGFALATHLEKIETDGTPLSGADRWKIGNPSLGNLSLLDFIEALARAPAGDYRAIVFVVTDAPWVQSTAAPGEAQIEGWAAGGINALPTNIGTLPFAEAYRATALVYQFRKRGSKQAEYVLPSPVSGEAHLEKGGIWKPLSIL